MYQAQEILPRHSRFLVDMGRWRRVASIEKMINNEVGPGWEVKSIKPLDTRGRRFLVTALYTQPVVQKVHVNVPVVLPEEEEKKPVMGEDIFSKTQMRRVMAERDEARSQVASLSERLAKAEELAKAQPTKKNVKKPTFAKEKKAEETPFTMLRNCVMGRLAEPTCFDSVNLNVAAVQCGAKERGIEPTRFAGPAIVQMTRLGYIEQVGERDGRRTYKVTEKGLDYLKEVRGDEHN